MVSPDVHPLTNGAPTWQSYVLLRDVIDGNGSVSAVERSEFGHENIFRVDTREEKFYMQAKSGEDMDQWLTHIRRALQVKYMPIWGAPGRSAYWRSGVT